MRRQVQISCVDINFMIVNCSGKGEVIANIYRHPVISHRSHRHILRFRIQGFQTFNICSKMS
jgi:hypothetical protein